MMITRRNFLKSSSLGALGAAAALTGLSVATLPQDASAAKPEFYTGLKKGYGAAGYDVVAYFTQKKPVKGTAKYETTWNGAKWAFSSQANLDKFKANPRKYAPQYGGYCAFAVSKGYTAKGDPNAWTVRNGKLYLNYSDQIRARWLNDVKNHISSGNKNWPNVLK